MALFLGNDEFNAFNESNVKIHIFLETLIDQYNDSTYVPIISVYNSMTCKQNNC